MDESTSLTTEFLAMLFAAAFWLTITSYDNPFSSDCNQHLLDENTVKIVCTSR